MYVEAFHRVLKYLYLKGKVNKRLDKCVGVLLKLARDKGFERLVKIEKGKTTERISQIRARHRASLKIPTDHITETEEYCTWKVKSADGKDVYHVTQINKQCPHNCSISCPDCHICVHIFSCNCPDALIRATICKHIHLLVRYISETSTSCTILPQEDLSQMNETVLLENLKDKIQFCELQTYKHQQLSTLAGQLHTISNIETLRDVKTLINSALNLIKARETVPTVLPVPRKEPPNKHIQTQRSFFSTKRKRKPSKVRIAKPTKQEKTDICNALLKGCKQLLPPFTQSTFSKYIIITCVSQ